MIPTIGVILFFSFYLESLAPGDPIDELLQLQGADHFPNRDAYLTAYRTVQKERGLQYPKFYWSIEPSYFPDTLQRISPKRNRIFLTKLLRQTGDWENIQTLNQNIHTAIRQSDHSGASQVLRQLLQIEKAETVNQLKIHLQQPILRNSDLASVLSLSEAVEKLEYDRPRSLLPAFKWHGSKSQFHFWIKSLFSKKNKSLLDGKPSFSKIKRALSWTLTMSIIALLMVALLSLGLGYVQVKYGGWLDRMSAGILYVLLAVPTFWLASLLVIFFTTPEYGTWTDIFPSIGMKPAFIPQSFFQELMTNAKQLILPIFCLVIASLSYLTLQVRNDLRDALKQPYITTARAKGLSESQVLRRHAVPNAMVPYITILSGSIPLLFTGSVIIEVIFAIPGIGQLMLTSVQESDWPVVFSIVLVISIATMIGYLIGDILLAKLYPKTLKNFT